MGQQLFYSFCKSCGGMRGWSNRKTVFNECKCNREKPMYKKMEDKDFELMNFILNSTSEISNTQKAEQYQYWKKRVVGRIDLLQPLIDELKNKNILLLEISPDLHKEWIELNNVKLYYNF
jgi:hypothetical protein